METISPEFRDLQREVFDLRERMAKNEGELTQLNRTAKDVTKQTIWQFIAFTVSIGGLILGLLNYQNSVIRNQFESMRNEFNSMRGEMNTHFDASKNSQAEFEKHINQRMDTLDKRISELKQR